MFRPAGPSRAGFPTIGPMEPVTRDVVLDVRLDRPKDTHRVEVRRIQMAPNVAAGLHVHNGPVVGSIVEGSVWFQVDGGTESVLEPGDTFFEPEGTRIRRFDARDAGVTFLAYFLLGPEQDTEMTFPEA